MGKRQGDLGQVHGEVKKSNQATAGEAIQIPITLNVH